MDGETLCPHPALQHAVVCGLLGLAVGCMLQTLLSPSLRSSGAGLVLLGLLPVHVGAFVGSLAGLLIALKPATAAAWCGFGPHSRTDWCRALAAAAWVYPAVAVVTEVVTRLWRFWSLPTAENPLVTVVRDHGAAATWLAAALAALVLAPVAEEVLFRLLLHDALQSVGVRASGLWTSLCFAGVHGIPEHVPGLVLLGLVLQSLRRRCGSVLPSMLCHAAFNGISLVLVWVLLRAGVALDAGL